MDQLHSANEAVEEQTEQAIQLHEVHFQLQGARRRDKFLHKFLDRVTGIFTPGWKLFLLQGQSFLSKFCRLAILLFW